MIGYPDRLSPYLAVLKGFSFIKIYVGDDIQRGSKWIREENGPPIAFKPSEGHFYSGMLAWPVP